MMYGTDDKKEMKNRKAFDAWEQSDVISSHSAPAESDELPSDVKNIIKNNIAEISANKTNPEKKKETKPDDAVVMSDSASQVKAEYASSFAKAKSKKENIVYSQLSKPARFSEKINLHEHLQEADSHEDIERIIEEQHSLRNSLILKFIVAIICTGFLAFFALAPILKIELPPIIDVTVMPVKSLIVNLVFLVVTGIVVHKVALSGIASLFSFSPDADTITSLSFYSALIGNLALLASYAAKGTAGSVVTASCTFSACAAAAIAFNVLGKIFIVSRVKNNFEFISDEDGEEYFAADNLSPEKAKDVFRIFDGIPNVVTAKKVDYISDYLDKAYSLSPSDTSSRNLTVVALIAAFIAAFAEGIIKHDFMAAIVAFSAVCCVASPLLLEFGVSFPFSRACKKLVKQKTLLTGCETLLNFEETDAIVTDSNFMFTDNGVRVHGIKTFSNKQIDKAVLFAASIAKAGKSPLYSAFANMFTDKTSTEKLLKQATKISYEDEKGIYAIIDNRTVLLGNRRLLRHHMVESPSRDYELRSADEGKDVVYLAIDGILWAMFIVEYNFDDASMEAYSKLHRFGVHVLIESSDPNITPMLLEEKCGLSSKNSLILGAREMQVLNSRKDGGINAAGLAFKNAAGYISGIISCIKLNATITANTTLQFVFSIIGILIIVCCSLFGGGIGTVLPAYILIFQVLSALPILLISFFRRN